MEEGGEAFCTRKLMNLLASEHRGHLQLIWLLSVPECAGGFPAPSDVADAGFGGILPYPFDLRVASLGRSVAHPLCVLVSWHCGC